ncbi:protein TIFY 8 isoform X2 [Vigna radiata var. radiata]|uniref:Protein TIFY n=1 Tax=Vigna radiata var. radiata TaxID=3916 RepID=A0A1S3U754_VIGRR|nr:protein TIFY 8 isoform X2 [Vigna radiata var. radiata]
MAVLLRMAQPHNGNTSNTFNQTLVLHDFLGMKSAADSPKTTDVRLSEPSASASSAGGRGPFSATSDIASEKQIGNHLEGVPFYGPRSDLSGAEISNRLVGSKRSNSDSAFTGSSRDAFQMVPDSYQNSHLMKVLRNAAGDRSRRPNDEDVLLGMQSMKQSSSQIFQPPTSAKIDANKWERSILMNVGPSMQYPPRGGQLAPFVHQMASSKIRDTNAGPSFISQSAADEGSRTGIKGPGILSSINVAAMSAEKTPSAVMLGGSRPKPGSNIIESSTPPSQPTLTSASRQMTIFYGGQAHVFDDVHPHKADVIMALAGSNGGSWSTAFSPKSAVKMVSDGNLHSGENETGVVNNVAFPQELHGKLSITASSSHAMGPGDRVTTPAGAHQGSVFTKDTRNPVQASDPSAEDKRGQ